MAKTYKKTVAVVAADEQEKTIASIAMVAHEANRAYCLTLGDDSQRPWADAPGWQRESAMSMVRAVLEGVARTPVQQHEHWMNEKLGEGWVWGEVKDAEKKTHPCLVSYFQLPVEQRRKDHLFRAIVMALSAPK